MIPGKTVEKRKTKSYPCTSGDDPIPFMLVTIPTELSLHKRGWSYGHEKRHCYRRVIPAQAGMILCTWFYKNLWSRYPCTSGDDPMGGRYKLVVVWLSLHKRGWSYYACRQMYYGFVIPAQAGMIPTHGAHNHPDGCYPCTSGDDPNTNKWDAQELQLSLHRQGLLI